MNQKVQFVVNKDSGDDENYFRSFEHLIDNTRELEIIV